MAGPLPVDFKRRDIEIVAGDSDGEVVRQRAVDPVVGELGDGSGGSNPAPSFLSEFGARPIIARSAVRLLSRSLRAEISCATIESYLACASFVSVIVATPTSKLRFACARFSDTAAFWLM